MSKKNKRQIKTGDHWLEDFINLMEITKKAVEELRCVNGTLQDIQDLHLSDINKLTSMEYSLSGAVERAREKYVTTADMWDDEATKHTEYSKEVQATTKGKK